MNVSRETKDRLNIYLELLLKWSPKINLVSSASLKNAAQRHFEDSLQVASLCPKDAKTLVDLGSGGGFPGAVIAIALSERDLRVTLVESDLRKATFLRTVSRETKVPFSVIAKRIEEVEPLDADALCARALSSLSDLFTYTERHMKSGGTALFPKGATWQNEVKDARNKWRFSCEPITSVTEPDAAILKIGGLSRV